MDLKEQATNQAELSDISKQRVAALQAARSALAGRTMFGQPGQSPTPLISLAEYILNGTTPWSNLPSEASDWKFGVTGPRLGRGAEKSAMFEFEEDADKRAAEATADMSDLDDDEQASIDKMGIIVRAERARKSDSSNYPAANIEDDEDDDDDAWS